MKLRIKAFLAAAVIAMGCIFCTGCNPAIIGILAAVMVPTTVGQVSASRITSADSTAAQIKNNATSFLTRMDTVRATMNNRSDFTMYISVDSSGKWTVSGGSASDWYDGENHWGTNSYVDTDYNTVFTAYMKDMLYDLENGYAEMHFSGGRCIGVTFVPGTSSKPDTALPSLSEFKDGFSPSAFPDEPGMSGSTVVGTSPKLGSAGGRY